MNQDQIKSLMRAIEKDSSVATNEHVQQAISSWYKQHEGAMEAMAPLLKAREIIEKNQALLESLKEKERLERKIFRITSNAALITTVGAAVSATVLPAITVPAAVAASLAALGGYISKLKLDNDAMSGARKIVAEVESQSGKDEQT